MRTPERVRQFAGILPRIGQEPSGFERICLPARQTHHGGGFEGGRAMSLEFDPRSSLQLTLRPAAAQDHGVTRVFVLLPTLSELLGEPAFGLRDPIVLPGHARPLSGWALFGSVRQRGFTLH
jgi:hypothetical protein